MSARSLTDLVGADVMQYPTELPEFEVSTSLEFTISRGVLAVQSSISNLVDGDVRPYMLTKLLINMIPDPKWREETTRKFNELCKKYGFNDIASREVVLICIDVIGRVTDWCIQFRGGNIHNVALGGL